MENLNTYKIIFKGEILPGFKLIEARERCARLMKLDEAQLDRMFSGRNITLKRNLLVEETNHFIKAFRQNGLLLHILLEEKDSTFTLEPIKIIEKSRWNPPIQYTGFFRKSRWQWLDNVIQKITIFDNLFKGRLSPIAYINELLICSLLFVTLAAIFSFIKSTFHVNVLLSIIQFTFGLIIYYRLLRIATMRLHDVGLSGTWSMFPAVFMFICSFFALNQWIIITNWGWNIAFFSMLSFVMGAPHDNKYGSAQIYTPEFQINTQNTQNTPNSEQLPKKQFHFDIFTTRYAQQSYYTDGNHHETTLFLDHYVPGRISRFSYITSELITWLLFSCLIFSVKVFVQPTSVNAPPPVWSEAVFFCLSLMCFLYSCYLTILRLHDIGYSGGWVLIGIFTLACVGFLSRLAFLQPYGFYLNILPIFMNALIIVLSGVIQGDPRENRFGEPIPQNTNKGLYIASIATPIFLLIITSILIFNNIGIG